MLCIALSLLWLFYSQRGNKILAGIRESLIGAYMPSGSIYGIDVSHYQGNINWDQVSQISYDPFLKRVKINGSKSKDLTFAIAKATEGSNGRFDDDTYATNSNAIRAKGIILGAYHVLTAGGDIVGQAKRFLEVSKLKKGDMRPILDVENDIRLKGNELIEAVKNWIGIVEKYYSCRPIIYTSVNLYQTTLGIDDFKDYDFWIAQYNNVTVDVKCAIWQFTSKGKIEGINGRVDLNVLTNEVMDIKNLLIP